MLAPMLLSSAVLLAVFFVIDSWYFRRADEQLKVDPTPDSPLRIEGWINLAVFGPLILLSVLISGVWKPGILFNVLGTQVELQNIVRDLSLIALTVLSMMFTPRDIRSANHYDWGPMLEVAKLFAGIFITIVPVLAILQAGSKGALAPLVAMVTGPAQGIGRAIAERLLNSGWSLVAIDRQAEGLQSLQALAPERVATALLDVTADDAPEQAMALARSRFGRLDALINNAGIGRPKPMHLTDDAELDRFLNVNLRSVFRFSRQALGLIGEGGCMVHVASTFGLMGNPGASAYAATKAALIGLTRQMAVDYGPKGLRINAVAPGLIHTELISDRLDQPAFRRLMVDTIPFPRLGKPSDVAAAVAFLCSEDASFVNGHVLVIDGGWSATNWVGSGAPA
jgi:3-oxoacyl-[acyl-carrier protein] reductase